MIDRDFIGLEGPPRSIEVEKGQLRTFARATGETNPIYWHEGVAARAGYHSLPALPTFGFILYVLAPGEGGMGRLMSIMKIKPDRVLHGEQRFEYLHPIHAGDVITLRDRVTDIYAKSGGALDFLEIEVPAVNQHGVLCVRQTILLAVRN